MFCYKEFLWNLSWTKFFVRLREVSTLEDVRFREVSLHTFSGYLVLAVAYVNNVARLSHKFCCCVFKECTVKPFCSGYHRGLSIVSVIEKCLLHSSYSQIFALGC